MGQLATISEHNVGNTTQLNWEDPDFLEGKEPWDADGINHVEGRHQDGTPWGDLAIKVGPEIAKRTTSILVQPDKNNLH